MSRSATLNLTDTHDRVIDVTCRLCILKCGQTRLSTSRNDYSWKEKRNLISRWENTFCRAAGFCRSSSILTFVRCSHTADIPLFLPSLKSRQPVIERIEHSSGPRAWKKARARGDFLFGASVTIVARATRFDRADSNLLVLISAGSIELVSHTGNPKRETDCHRATVDLSRVVREIRLP